MNTELEPRIFGHEQTRAKLDRIASATLHPQSFLFFGPKHLGKSLVARAFALKLIGTPALPNGFHPDLFVLGNEPNEEKEKKSLSIEAVREAQSFLSRFPEQGTYRVVIIDHAETLTHSAENALLKILEEPNTSSIIILVSSRPGKLLATVRSRLFPVAFSPLSSEELHSSFPDAKDIPEFFFSLGLPGLIQSSMQAPASFEVTKSQLKKLFQLSKLTWAERITLAESLSKDPDELENILDIWLIGLARPREGSTGKTPKEAAFLESVMEAMDSISEKHGSDRLTIEKLFTSLS